VGVIGRLHPVKGQQYFLEAAAKVLEDRPDATFMLAGTGADQERLKNLAERLGISDQVKFLGFVEDVPTLLTGLDLVVIPSLAEGFGLIAAEALALEVPVVATQVGGLPEVVQDHVTGLLVNPADDTSLAKGILWMLNHPHEAKDMAKKGRKFVRQHFSSQAMAERTKQLYLEVAGKYV
jgi:glycosyltransferase involved in cell wall biosynthesis